MSLTMPADYGELPESMKRRVSLTLLWIFIAGLPVWAQEKLYPVRDNKDVSVLISTDRLSFVVERAFQHRLTLGFPDDDELSILPDTRAPILILWMKIQNVAHEPLELNVSKFTGTDDEGKRYPVLIPDVAADRILAAASGGSIGTKTLRSISLGRAGKKVSVEQARDDILRYSLQPGTLPAGGVSEGFVYFEAPMKKKYRLNVALGDLWSKPLVFSTEKSK